MDENKNNNYTPFSQNIYEQGMSAHRFSDNGTTSFNVRNTGFFAGVKQKMRNPIFAVATLLLAGVAFASVIAMSYPDGDSDANVPIIKADAGNYKVTPDSSGGMDIANRDTTIFDVLRPNAPAVANLLEQQDDNFEQGVFEDDQDTTQYVLADARDVTPKEPMIENLLDPAPLKSEEVLSDISTAAGDKDAVFKTDQDSDDVSAFEQPKAPDLTSKNETSARPDSLHAAASSPETLAYVRSVLTEEKSAPEKKTAPTQAENTAKKVNNIAPASGGDIKANPVSSNERYYVQLGSITSQNGAEKEWLVLKKKFSSELSSFNKHRVQKAELGARGTFYRIQAGPMSKSQATSACNAIKITKPGGCLVVR